MFCRPDYAGSTIPAELLSVLVLFDVGSDHNGVLYAGQRSKLIDDMASLLSPCEAKTSADQVASFHDTAFCCSCFVGNVANDRFCIFRAMV